MSIEVSRLGDIREVLMESVHRRGRLHIDLIHITMRMLDGFASKLSSKEPHSNLQSQI